VDVDGVMKIMTIIIIIIIIIIRNILYDGIKERETERSSWNCEL
jgi:hypothetical protein